MRIQVLKTLLFSVFVLLLLTTLSYKTPFMYSVEKRFQSDFGVSRHSSLNLNAGGMVTPIYTGLHKASLCTEGVILGLGYTKG